MRALQRNKQTFYYALYLGSTESKDEDGYYTGGNDINIFHPC